ncbi:Uncharacterised protein [Streptococcus pseudoporcinus]|uniref:Uncharacterized protein n=1 Tax=Streptococcus pseudoporcinus TaxID=361101 RepID=A0A4U9Y234_9STRE|nr:hypothetical protein [Streptococcus pseudoporcinus]QBX18704.1 hypothetical protein Javan443_0030 [Streptococcus phage Javan443]QBX18777.1 hypothetical protein Javan445_0037 [Streptococcus phage Javan445]VTS19706.1 Uncharacterised protein [Streptococcus pseudoporcinus]VUC69698.1 Uncharacterised protein [Streptococcus pseudoporcinus]VUC99994.1 Uncharacterised protein [Streptococcus pseudoporcinus]
MTKYDIIREQAVPLLWGFGGRNSTKFEMDGKFYRLTLEEVEE